MKKLILPILMIWMLGCEQESKLEDSIYIPDAQVPELPAYTEWGYNTFGAQYERSVFVYDPQKIPLKVTTDGNELVFIMQGLSNISYSSNDQTLKIVLPAGEVASYRDLLVLHDSIIDLSTQAIRVEEICNGNGQVLDLISGEFHVKRGQQVFVDDKEEEIILSGTFRLSYMNEDIPVSMRNGRFDFGINENNFFVLN